MFARTRALGTWVNLTDVEGFELEDLDAKTAAAIDGNAGGPYEPSEIISIGGAGLEVTGPFVATGTANFNTVQTTKAGVLIGSGGVLIGGDIPGLALLAGNLSISNGNASIFGTLSVSNDVNFGGELTVNGLLNATGQVSAGSVLCGGGGLFAGALLLESTLLVGGAATFNDSVVFTSSNPDVTRTIDCYSTFNARGAFRCVGDGRIVKRVKVSNIIGLSLGESITVGPLDTDIVMMAGDNVLQGNILWRISTYGAEDGNVIEVSRALESSGFFVNVVNDTDLTSIINLDGTNYSSATLVFQGGAWKVLHRYKDHN